MTVPGLAAVVLAGGRSRRMGRDKASLDWHGVPLLRHVVDAVASLCGTVVVVRADGQQLPVLPTDVVVVDDPAPGLGPLQGMAAGLAAVHGAPAAFVAATDLPLLAPELVACVAGRLVEDDLAEIVVPSVGGWWHPLAAAYRPTLAAAAQHAVDERHLRVRDFVASRATVVLSEGDLLADPALAAADPDLLGLSNVNEPADLTRLRARAPDGRRG